MNLFERFFRFGLVGGSGVLVDMAVLYLLHDPSRLGLPLVISKVVSAQLAMINNFTWNETWTFADRRGARSAPGPLVKRFLRFELICLAGLLLNLGVLTLCVKRLGMHYLLGNVIAIAVSTAWNFLLNLRWNWSSPAEGEAR